MKNNYRILRTNSNKNPQEKKTTMSSQDIRLKIDLLLGESVHKSVLNTQELKAVFEFIMNRHKEFKFRKACPNYARNVGKPTIPSKNTASIRHVHNSIKNAVLQCNDDYLKVLEVTIKLFAKTKYENLTASQTCQPKTGQQTSLQLTGQDTFPKQSVSTNNTPWSQNDLNDFHWQCQKRSGGNGCVLYGHVNFSSNPTVKDLESIQIVTIYDAPTLDCINTNTAGVGETGFNDFRKSFDHDKISIFGEKSCIVELIKSACDSNFEIKYTSDDENDWVELMVEQLNFFPNLKLLRVLCKSKRAKKLLHRLGLVNNPDALGKVQALRIHDRDIHVIWLYHPSNNFKSNDRDKKENGHRGLMKNHPNLKGLLKESVDEKEYIQFIENAMAKYDENRNPKLSLKPKTTEKTEKETKPTSSTPAPTYTLPFTSYKQILKDKIFNNRKDIQEMRKKNRDSLKGKTQKPVIHGQGLISAAVQKAPTKEVSSVIKKPQAPTNTQSSSQQDLSPVEKQNSIIETKINPQLITAKKNLQLEDLATDNRMVPNNHTTGSNQNSSNPATTSPQILDNSNSKVPSRGRRVFIIRTDVQVNWQSIRDLFEKQIGGVEYVKLYKNSNGGHIDFKDEESVAKALKKKTIRNEKANSQFSSSKVFVKEWKK